MIKLNPKYVLALRNRSRIWLEKKDYEKALADLDEAIRLDARITAPTSTEVSPGEKSRNTSRRSPISMRPLASIPRMPLRISTAARRGRI